MDMPKNIFRNGTKSRESLPLRNEANRKTTSKGLQEGTQEICPTATGAEHRTAKDTQAGQVLPEHLAQVNHKHGI